jgi:hypothetical protein
MHLWRNAHITVPPPPPSSHETTGIFAEVAWAGDKQFELSTRPGQSPIHYSSSAREFLCVSSAVTGTVQCKSTSELNNDVGEVSAPPSITPPPPPLHSNTHLFPCWFGTKIIIITPQKPSTDTIHIPTIFFPKMNFKVVCPWPSSFTSGIYPWGFFLTKILYASFSSWFKLHVHFIITLSPGLPSKQTYMNGHKHWSFPHHSHLQIFYSA